MSNLTANDVLDLVALLDQTDTLTELGIGTATCGIAIAHVEVGRGIVVTPCQRVGGHAGAHEPVVEL